MRRESDTSLKAIVAGAIGGAAVAAYAVRASIRAARSFDFAGKTALITGGSRGLGLAIAQRLAREGANLAICARDEDELDRARVELQTLGVEVLAIQCDVTSPAQVEGMVDAIVRHFGSLDVLINNAGTIQVGPLETMTTADFDRAMATHFNGPLHAILAALPAMRRQGGGRIVNISSVGGRVPVPHLVPYSASKFALVGLSEGLRTELQPENIYVTTVCPGLMRTGSPPNATFKGQAEKEYAWFATGDSLPFVTISADRMAARILNACRHGDAELTSPWSAKMPAMLHGVLPGLTTELMALQGRLLPGAGGSGTAMKKGHQARQLEPTFARQRNDEAAAENNNAAPAKMP